MGEIASCKGLSLQNISAVLLAEQYLLNSNLYSVSNTGHLTMSIDSAIALLAMHEQVLLMVVLPEWCHARWEMKGKYFYTGQQIGQTSHSGKFLS